MAGTLDIKVHDAKLTRDTELFGKMTPFVQIEIGAQMKKTAPHSRGGKTPEFNGEILRFKITNETQMKLIVYDEEKMKKKHDLVGDAIFFLNKVCSGEIKKHTIEVLHKGKSAGFVNIEFDFMTKLGQEVGKQLVAGLNLPPGSKPGMQPKLPVPPMP